MKRKYALIFFVLSLLLTVVCMGAYREDRAVIKLVDGNVSVVFCDHHIAPTDTLVASEIHARKINEPYRVKIGVVSDMVACGHGYRTALLYCFPTLKDAVDAFMKKAYVEAVDAQISFRPDEKEIFEITSEQPGHKVNEAKLYRDIFYGLRSGREIVVTAQRLTIFPTVRAEMLKEETHLRASYCTDYSSSSPSRKHNINLALSKINGTVLEKSEQFSFNSTVGRRTESNGFLPAKIIVGGKYEEGYGGGVCQASTTLYNAVLLSGLSVTAAQRHSLKVAYELPSFDAMVNGSYSDLRFVNDSTGKIYIRACGDGKQVRVEIYGKRLAYEIKRRSVVVAEGELPGYEEIEDAECKYFSEQDAVGSRLIVSYPKASLKSEGYLDYYKNGVLYKSVLLRTDRYAETVGVIAIKTE
ncbi:MAG: VanW family protein [Clostridia bacterium]|nr:VanW family protein [Clostridia bacterium]